MDSVLGVVAVPVEDVGVDPGVDVAGVDPVGAGVDEVVVLDADEEGFLCDFRGLVFFLSVFFGLKRSSSSLEDAGGKAACFSGSET